MNNSNEFLQAYNNLKECIRIFEAGLSKNLSKEEWEAAKNIEKLCASYLNHFYSAQESRYIWDIDKRSEIKND